MIYINQVIKYIPLECLAKQYDMEIKRVLLCFSYAHAHKLIDKCKGMILKLVVLFVAMMLVLSLYFFCCIDCNLLLYNVGLH